MTATVSVQLSGSNHRARVLGWGITSSSTHSAATASQVAADKLAKQTGKAVLRRERITHSLSHEFWQITLED